jgi:hypothetical protein
MKTHRRHRAAADVLLGWDFAGRDPFPAVAGRAPGIAKPAHTRSLPAPA